MEQWILLGMGPVFLACIALEAWYWRRRGAAMYTWIDTLSNAGLALMHQAADAVAWALVIGVYYLVWRHRVFDIPTTAWTIAGLFLAQDFFYYFFHRASHRIRWMWASHVTHHSSERLAPGFSSPGRRQSILSCPWARYMASSSVPCSARRDRAARSPIGAG